MNHKAPMPMAHFDNAPERGSATRSNFRKTRRVRMIASALKSRQSGGSPTRVPHHPGSNNAGKFFDPLFVILRK
jgi:hypothetical protein